MLCHSLRCAVTLSRRAAIWFTKLIVGLSDYALEDFLLVLGTQMLSDFLFLSPELSTGARKRLRSTHNAVRFSVLLGNHLSACAGYLHVV